MPFVYWLLLRSFWLYCFCSSLSLSRSHTIRAYSFTSISSRCVAIDLPFLLLLVFLFFLVPTLSCTYNEQFVWQCIKWSGKMWAEKNTHSQTHTHIHRERYIPPSSSSRTGLCNVMCVLYHIDLRLARLIQDSVCVYCVYISGALVCVVYFPF